MKGETKGSPMYFVASKMLSISFTEFVQQYWSLQRHKFDFESTASV